MKNEIQVNLSHTKPYKCTQKVGLVGGAECGSEQFSQIFFVRILPALLSPTTKSEIIPIQTFKCIKCGKIADLGQLPVEISS